MSTTTVRLDRDDDALLDSLAPEFGGRSSAIRHAIRTLAADRRRHDALLEWLDTWGARTPADVLKKLEDEIAAMTERYGL